jgi:hypothetical protein
MVVITSAIDSRDGVFIGGKHLHHNFKPMTNTELTLDQLTAIAGGVQMGPDGSTCTDRFTWKDIKDILGCSKGIVHPEFRLGGSAEPGRDDI